MTDVTEKSEWTSNWLISFLEGEDDNLIRADGYFSRVFRVLSGTPGIRVELDPRQVGKLEKPSDWAFAVTAKELYRLIEAYHKLVAWLQVIEDLYQVEVAYSVLGDGIPSQNS